MRSNSTKIFAFVTAFYAAMLWAVHIESAVKRDSLYEYTGDGVLRIVDVSTQENLRVVYRDNDGRYSDQALEAIDFVLRCHGKKETRHLSLKLVELIDHIQDHFGTDEVRVVSGYRSPEYNESLRRHLSRVAHDSLHMQGMAMDIKFEGVGKHELAEYARSIEAGGVGKYRRSSFIHVDVGPVRNW